MKRFLVLFLAVLIGCMGLSACDTDTADKSIVVMTSSNWIQKVDQDLAKKFYDESGIKVKFLPVSDGDYSKNLDSVLGDGSDTVDVFYFGGGMDMKSKGIDKLAVELTDESWVGNYEIWAKSASSIDNKVYGFNTWGVDWEGIIYNKTYFASKGLSVPKTWAEFITLCDAISDDGIVPFYENYNDNWHGYGWLYGWTNALLAEYPDMYTALNNNTKAFADYPKFVEGVGQVGDFFSAKKDSKAKYYQNDGSANDWASSYVYMNSKQEGTEKPKSVMLFTYSSQVKEEGWVNAATAAGTNYEFGMFPLPVLNNTVAVSNGGGNQRYINKNSKKIDYCKQYFNFLAKSENLETYYAARQDLCSAAFKGVTSVSTTACTTDIQKNSVNALGAQVAIPEMLSKNVLYFWNYNPTPDLQKLNAGTITVAQIITELDNTRKAAFDKVS